MREIIKGYAGKFDRFVYLVQDSDSSVICIFSSAKRADEYLTYLLANTFAEPGELTIHKRPLNPWPGDRDV